MNNKMIEPAPRGAQHYPIRVIETDKMLLTTQEVSDWCILQAGHAQKVFRIV